MKKKKPSLCLVLSIILFISMFILSGIIIQITFSEQKNTQTIKLNNNNNIRTISPGRNESTTSNIKRDTDINQYESTSISTHVIGDYNIVILVICFDRAQYLQKTLDNIVLHHPKNNIDIIISEDGKNQSIAEVISLVRTKLAITIPNIKLNHIHHPFGDAFAENGYFKLSKHFKWALTQAFSYSREPCDKQLRAATNCNQVENVIILEEDIIIAPDFFSLMLSTAPLLQNDKTLLAISAWNDNGQESFVRDPKQLYRSDFFPGLGWMLNRRIWEELNSIWPAAYWDDWLREPARRKGRQIIRPEISRTYHIGVKGVSNSEFGNYLQLIKLNDRPVDFNALDLSYLERDTWDANYLSQVYDSPIISVESLPSTAYSQVRIPYSSLDDINDATSFTRIARKLGIMDNIKAGVPRTAYKGVVSVWIKDVKVHVAPTI